MRLCTLFPNWKGDMPALNINFPLKDVANAYGDDQSAELSVTERALKAIRSHLNMDVAFVSEFVDGQAVMRGVDMVDGNESLKVGDSFALQDIYCGEVLAGRLPNVIPDTSKEPLAKAKHVTDALPAGSYLGVPVQLDDGRPFGMFCCLSFEADPTLNERDLKILKAFAELTAYEINREIESAQSIELERTRISSAIDEGNFSLVFQPIWNLELGQPVGLECLTRFPDSDKCSPADWFRKAADLGFGSDLERATIRRALTALDALPEHVHLAVNASPATIMDDGLQKLFKNIRADRIVLEVTEHAVVSDYPALLAALAPLRRRGMRLAVDDAGAGYSGLQHILHLRPDLIKLDMSLTRNIDSDNARRALTSALINFGHQTGCRIVAEGVETGSELETLMDLGVEKAQGFHLGPPLPLENTIALFGTTDSRKVSAAG
jgi:EAL domain-containing protein (putative c-di-GMP-specific phosphodiesterase class I)